MLNSDQYRITAIKHYFILMKEDSILKTYKVFYSVIIGVMSLAFASSAFATRHIPVVRKIVIEAPLGMTAPEILAERTIEIRDGDKSINVQRGEIVRIKKDGKTFTWKFDVLNITKFPLCEIAPQEMNVGNMNVYLSRGPMDLN